MWRLRLSHSVSLPCDDVSQRKGVMANDRDPRSDLGVWLGEKLRIAREAAGYTSQDALARDLGFDRTTINKLETGVRPPSDDVAGKIAARFPDLCNGIGCVF